MAYVWVVGLLELALEVLYRALAPDSPERLLARGLRGSSRAPVRPRPPGSSASSQMDPARLFL